MAKGCALSTGYLPQGGLPRNSVDRITDRPDMTSAVDRGRKASTETISILVNFIFGFILLPKMFKFCYWFEYSAWLAIILALKLEKIFTSKSKHDIIFFMVVLNSGYLVIFCHISLVSLHYVFVNLYI